MKTPKQVVSNKLHWAKQTLQCRNDTMLAWKANTAADLFFAEIIVDVALSASSFLTYVCAEYYAKDKPIKDYPQQILTRFTQLLQSDRRRGVQGVEFGMPATVLGTDIQIWMVDVSGKYKEKRQKFLDTGAYEAYLLTPEWKYRAERRLEIDGHECQFCTGKDNLHVHHRTYDRRGHERDDDLITICSACHAKLHGRTERSYRNAAA